MWVLVSYNRCFYQDGDWREGHYAEVENGMLVVYAVSSLAAGTMSKVKNVTFDGLEVTVLYEDDGGAVRSVVLLVGSERSRDLWVSHLTHAQFFSGESRELRFESVVIKSPTKDESRGEVASSPGITARKRESITGQWDAFTSFMGAWHRRLFQLFADGSLAYYEVVPVACISLYSESSLLCLEAGPAERCGNLPIAPLTITSCGADAVLPKPPAEILPPLNQISRRLSKAVGSFSMPKTDEPPPKTQGWGSVVNQITIGNSSHSVRDEWIKQLQQYSAWFASETYANDSPDRRAKVILKGWGWKKGQTPFAGWKLRYFVLLSSREMLYYENDKSKTSLGTIDLRKKKDVRFAKSSDRPQGFEEIMEIETTGRTYYFSPKALNRGEHSNVMGRWMQALVASNENYEKHHSEAGGRKPFSTYSTNTFFIPPAGDNSLVEQEEKIIPVVKLSSWQRMTGNMPTAVLSPSPYKTEVLNGQAGARGTVDQA